MAPTTPHRAAADASPSSSKTHRVSKSRSARNTSSRMTRQRSNMHAERNSDGNHILQEMVNEAQAVVGCSGGSSGSSKGKLKSEGEAAASDIDGAVRVMEGVESPTHLQGSKCPPQDTVEKPFRLMELPAEIRLEIYRCCLTRPYNILLSKREQPPIIDLEDDGSPVRRALQSTDSDEDDPLAIPITVRACASSTYISAFYAPHRTRLASHSRGLRSRGTRPLRLTSSRSAPLPYTNNATASGGSNATSRSSRPVRRVADSRSRRQILPPEPPRPQSQDPLIVNVLRTTKQIYKEARSVLYSENLFTLDLATAMPTLACLHQRSRRQIKHVEIEIPTYNEILERFQETVRLSLRYCSGLKEFVIHMPFTLPGADGSGTTGNTTVYANGFDILRWLPQECNINLRGNVCTEIETVVKKHQHLARMLDKVRHHSLQYSPWAEKLKWKLELQQFEETGGSCYGS